MKSPSIKNYAKAGFGLGLGVYAAQIVFLLIGLALFVPGYQMMQKAKKNKESIPVTGIVLMGLGVVLMGGIGFGALLDGFSE